MAFVTSGTYKSPKTKTVQRATITTTTTIEGTGVVWNITTAAAAYDVTVANYDPNRVSAFDPDQNPPMVVIKCSVNTGTYNVAIKSDDGAGGTTTHYTFAADYSSTPRYVVLRLQSGLNIWQVA